VSKGILPSDPSRADHRMVGCILKTFFKDKNILHVPEEFDRVSKVFARAGGSWERLFEGSVRDVNLLKRIVKVAINEGFMSKAPRFR
jgi:hypothetical protein